MRGRRGGGEQGFALLAALLITVLAALAIGALATIAVAGLAISADDIAASRAGDTAEIGVAEALERLRWGWAPLASASSFSALGVGTDGGGSYDVVTAPVPPGDVRQPLLAAPAALRPDDPGLAALTIRVTGRWGPATRTVTLVTLATPDALPRGLVVGGSATLDAALELQGCGLYAGGDVNGRERVAFTAPPADSGGPPADQSPLPDLAWGGLWPKAGVHCGGGIWVGDHEEHDGFVESGPDDSDAHVGQGPPPAITAAPASALLAALVAHASDPGAALARAGSTSRCSIAPPHRHSPSLSCRRQAVSTSFRAARASRCDSSGCGRRARSLVR